MITMLSYVLFSYAAFDLPIHTLRLLHSLALASQLTLCAPFAFVLSVISTNSLCTPFASFLSGFLTNSLHTFCIRSLRLLNYLFLQRLFAFSRSSEHVSRNARGQDHAGPFHETTHLKRPNDTLLYLTMPRLSPLCLRFGRYLRPFAHDTTYIMKNNKL